jgi:hypothetical protein
MVKTRKAKKIFWGCIREFTIPLLLPLLLPLLPILPLHSLGFTSFDALSISGNL